METFCCKTRIIAGKAAREVIREMGFARLLVVADPFFVENGRHSAPNFSINAAVRAQYCAPQRSKLHASMKGLHS